MDERVRKAFSYAQLYLEKKIEFWTTHDNQEAVDHYQNELATLNASLDELIAESYSLEII